MNTDIIKIERRGRTAVVRFDRGVNLNAFNQELIQGLTEVAIEFQSDVETQSVVLTGGAKAFSAGIDLKDSSNWEEIDDDVQLRERFYRGVRLCQAWEDMPQITVAAIEGFAVGAGVAIALACDWRVMSRTAYLYVPEVKIGLNLQWGALPRLITLVGPARAKRIVVLCEKMAAEHALEWGLVEEITEEGAAVEKALELATGAAEMPAATVRMIKEAVNATAGALHRVSAFADADQSQLSRGFKAATAAREQFLNKG
jgi:enoyl-CoA hydratase/carnithine racemase